MRQAQKIEEKTNTKCKTVIDARIGEMNTWHRDSVWYINVQRISVKLQKKYTWYIRWEIDQKCMTKIVVIVVFCHYWLSITKHNRFRVKLHYIASTPICEYFNCYFVTNEHTPTTCYITIHTDTKTRGTHSRFTLSIYFKCVRSKIIDAFFSGPSPGIQRWSFDS